MRINKGFGKISVVLKLDLDRFLFFVPSLSRFSREITPDRNSNGPEIIRKFVTDFVGRFTSDNCSREP